MPKRPSAKDRQFRKSFAGLEEAAVVGHEEDENFEEEELFQGLLAIGTLGSDPPVADHHRTSVETITEKDTDVTPDELKLINEELEKVLGMEVKEPKEDMADLSSGRNSHAGTLIVGSGKPSVEAENVTAVCPLQGYLFGSPIELPETGRATKEQRTSLGELFQRSRMAEEKSGGGKWEREEKREGGDKSGVQLVKKMLKRRVTNTRGGGGGSAADSAETKLTKILHIFHRKVHPESSTASKKGPKSERHEAKSNTRYDGGGESTIPPLPEHDTVLLPERFIRKEGTRRLMCRSNPPPFTLSGSDSNGNREYWIKTDADYLVLEL